MAVICPLKKTPEYDENASYAADETPEGYCTTRCAWYLGPLDINHDFEIQHGQCAVNYIGKYLADQVYRKEGR